MDYIHPDLRTLAVPIDSLTPDDGNARRHDERNLAAIRHSLTQFGVRQPLVAQRSGDKIIVRAGNGRLEVAKELGLTHLPVVVYEESDTEAVAYAIADNRTAELASWDFDALASTMFALKDDFEFTALGWSESECKAMTAALEAAGDDGLPHVSPKLVNRQPLDPDNIPDYDEAVDYYVIKVLEVPPAAKDAVVNAINAALNGGSLAELGLVARAY